MIQPCGCAHIQDVLPVINQTNPIAMQGWVDADMNTPLESGQMLNVTPFPPRGEWTIQKLNERDYWFFANAYSVTVHVGDHGVLLIDAPPFLPVDELLAQIKKITDLPLDALVYSHAHFDHIGHACELQQQVGTLSIFGSERCRREIEHYGRQTLLPTHVITENRGGFNYEGRPFVLGTPVEWAHSGADSYIITPGGVMHFDDFVYPGRLPLTNISNMENLDGYIRFLRHVAGEQWTHANLGHCNVGCHEDVRRTLDYFQDIMETGYQFQHDNWTLDMFDFPEDEARVNIAAIMRNMMDMQVSSVAEMLSARWGHVAHFEVARDHIEHVLTDLGMYYDSQAGPHVLPSFAPISPVTHTEVSS